MLSTDAPADSLRSTHVRAMSPSSRHLLNLATTRSALVRALVGELERTDVVVLLMLSDEAATETRRPFMRFLTAVADTRYVVIQMYWTPDPPVAHVPLLAHELQHALELSGAPDVRDQESYTRLLAKIGWELGPRRFETHAARATEERVRRELGPNP